MKRILHVFKHCCTLAMKKVWRNYALTDYLIPMTKRKVGRAILHCFWVYLNISMSQQNIARI